MGACTFHFSCDLQCRFQRVHRSWLTVHEIGHPRRSLEAAQPSECFLRIGVGRHRINLLDARMHRNHLPANLHLARAIHQLPAACAGRLVTDKQHRAALVWQRAEQVIQDAPARRHAAGRDDDRRNFRSHELGRLLCRRHRLKSRGEEPADGISRLNVLVQFVSHGWRSSAAHRAPSGYRETRAASGSCRSSSSLLIQYRTSSTRPIAKAGMITLPPLATVSLMIAARRAP